MFFLFFYLTLHMPSLKCIRWMSYFFFLGQWCRLSAFVLMWQQFMLVCFVKSWWLLEDKWIEFCINLNLWVFKIVLKIFLCLYLLGEYALVHHLTFKTLWVIDLSVQWHVEILSSTQESHCLSLYKYRQAVWLWLKAFFNWWPKCYAFLWTIHMSCVFYYPVFVMCKS